MTRSVAPNAVIPKTCDVCGEAEPVDGAPCKHPHYLRIVYYYGCQQCQTLNSWASAYHVHRWEKQTGERLPEDREPRFCKNAAAAGEAPDAGRCARVPLPRLVGAQCFMCGMDQWPHAEEPLYRLYRLYREDGVTPCDDYQGDRDVINTRIHNHVSILHPDKWHDVIA